MVFKWVFTVYSDYVILVQIHVTVKAGSSFATCLLCSVVSAWMPLWRSWFRTLFGENFFLKKKCLNFFFFLTIDTEVIKDLSPYWWRWFCGLTVGRNWRIHRKPTYLTRWPQIIKHANVGDQTLATLVRGQSILPTIWTANKTFISSG